AFAHPQAIEFSLAMPTTRPFLPSRSLAFTAGSIWSLSCCQMWSCFEMMVCKVCYRIRLGGDLWRRRRLVGPKRDFRLHALKPDAAHLFIRFQYRLLQLHCRLGAVRAPIQKNG